MTDYDGLVVARTLRRREQINPECLPSHFERSLRRFRVKSRHRQKSHVENVERARQIDVRLRDGDMQTIPADYVVSNMEVIPAVQKLLGAPRKMMRKLTSAATVFP